MTDPLFCKLDVFTVVNRMIIEKVVKDIVKNFGAILMGCKIPDNRGRSLKVIVDTVEGISLDQITKLSKTIQKSKRLNELISDNFSLEVTSPGLNYPMTEWFQYQRNVNRKMRLFHNIQELPNPMEGVLKNFENDLLEIKSDNKTYEIPFNKIKYGKILL